MALVDKAFGDIITFTRASGGGRINSLGQFEWMVTNVPRLTYDPVTLQPLGLLVEEQRTNLAVQSGDFTSVSWTKLGGPIITPLTKGQRIDFPAQLDLVAQNTQSIAANTPHTVFVIAARDSGKCTLRIANANGSQLVRAAIDTAARTLTSKSSVGTGVFVSATVTPFELGWDIYALTGSFTEAQTGMGPRLIREASDGTTITILGVQFEAGAFPSSYIPTGASQVTRAADMATVDTLSPWYNPMEGTLVVEGATNAAGALPTAASINDGTLANIMVLRHTGTTAGGGVVVSGNAVQGGAFTSLAGSWPIGAQRKVALSCRLNAFAFSCNGEATQTDTSGTVPVVTQLNIGLAPFSNNWNGTISRITYYPRVIDVQQASA